MTLKYVVNVDAVERHLKYFSIIDIIQEQFYSNFFLADYMEISSLILFSLYWGHIGSNPTL